MPWNNSYPDLPVVILAAGEGHRLSEHSSLSPKPLQKIKGISLAERCMTTFAKLNFRKFIIVIGYKRKKVREHFKEIAQRISLHVSFATALEWKKGNGASTLAALPHLKNTPFLLTMVDHLLPPQFIKSFLSQLNCKEMALAVDKHIHSIFDLPDATKVLIQNNSIVKIGKKIRKYNAIDTGLFFCTEKLFGALKEARKNNCHSLTDGISILAKQKKIKAIDVSGFSWFDVDTKASLKHAEKYGTSLAFL